MSLLLLSFVVSPAVEARPGCLTLDMRERAMFANAGEGDRPASIGYVDSKTYPIRVHYNREADAERAATVVLASAEMAWAVEVDQMGWPAPASDAGLGGSDSFDFYMTKEGTYGGAWTWGPRKDVVSGDDWYSIASFVALDQDGITDADMDDFVVHEFNHALQYTIDGVESTSFVWESTAEAMEELAIPSTDLYVIDIQDFQSLPFESLLFDGYSSEVTAYNKYSLYEYGGSISGLYLEQAYGKNDGTTLLQLWLDMAQGDTADEPDYVDALGMIGGNIAPTYEDVYMGLAEWRMFVHTDDDGAHYSEAADWGKKSMVATEGTLNLSALDGTSVTPTDAPYDLGASYWKIAVDDAEGGTLHLDLKGAKAAQWGIVASAWQKSGPALVVKQRAGDTVSADLDLTGATQVMVAVVDLGAPELDAEARHPRADFSLSFRRDLPEVDTGDTAEDSGDTATDSATDSGTDEGATDDEDTKEPRACGCAATPNAGMSGLLLVGMVFLGRRRRVES